MEARRLSIFMTCVLLPPTFFVAALLAYYVLRLHTMEDFQSETDSDYTSYWRDWVSAFRLNTGHA